MIKISTFSRKIAIYMRWAYKIGQFKLINKITIMSAIKQDGAPTEAPTTANIERLATAEIYSALESVGAEISRFRGMFQQCFVEAGRCGDTAHYLYSLRGYIYLQLFKVLQEIDGFIGEDKLEAKHELPRHNRLIATAETMAGDIIDSVMLQVGMAGVNLSDEVLSPVFLAHKRDLYEKRLWPTAYER
ncbi:MAG: hypothetical protein ABH856_01105 [Patescibacteria group bacterium]|nr:hypothetical protein [Patescibacteria group bacterium]